LLNICIRPTTLRHSNGRTALQVGDSATTSSPLSFDKEPYGAGAFGMAAPARPYWTGYLKLSLVTISVRLYTATSERERVRFHQIHEPSGERVRQQLVVPGIGPVEREDTVKGFEYEKGHYLTVDPGDLKRLRLERIDRI